MTKFPGDGGLLMLNIASPIGGISPRRAIEGIADAAKLCLIGKEFWEIC